MHVQNTLTFLSLDFINKTGKLTNVSVTQNSVCPTLQRHSFDIFVIRCVRLR